MSAEQHAEIATRHLRVCGRFGQVVAAGPGRWSAPSPCSDWDARAVVEHVIGFHDVLLLRPMGAKPVRPKDDPVRRWELTWTALGALLGQPGLFDGLVDVPAIGNNPSTRIDAAPLVGLLSQDVLVHTWDLARAVGADDQLDPELCTFFLSRLPDDQTEQVRSGMYGPPLEPPPDAGPQAALLARMGRDPGWQPPAGDRR